ncbi:MAG: MAPEG family protein [Bdellovibrionales bacterium]|nr:MAPEG family protein [Bdellovibrionales bacterium]
MEKFLLPIVPIYIGCVVLLGVTLFRTRVRALKEKRVHFSYFQDYQGSIPKDLMLLQNHFNNQFQLPPVFLIVVVTAVSVQTVSVLTLVLGYGFLISRALHTHFHVVTQKVLFRAYSYFAGTLMTLILSVELAVRYWLQFS